MNKVRVLYSSSKSDVTGGGQKSLLLVLKNLDRERYEPVLLCPAPGKLAQQAGDMGVQVVVMAMPALVRFSLPCLVRLVRLIRRADICLIHTDGPRNTLYLGLASKLIGVPLVWHVRVGTGESYLYERFLFHLSTRIVAVSKACAQRFAEFAGFEEKVRIVYNAVDVKEFNLGGSNKSHDEEDKMVVGIVGRIEPLKGQEDLIRAAKEVLCERGNIRFMIVGAGSDDYVESLKELTHELGVFENVQFLGFREDIKAELSKIDILVNASKIQGRSGGEGFSRIIVEAMAMGIVVVATTVGGNTEAVLDGETGVLVPPGNIRALSTAIWGLCYDQAKMQKMSKNARDRVLDYFNSEKQIKAIQAIYENTLRKEKI